ncbi:branched-chain amino acid ABC transporter permease [soil metagenome]
MGELSFAIPLIVDGALVGLMYSLIAIGFVLIYKATDAINFAQGEFVMFAGIAAAAFTAWGVGFWAAVLLTIGLMIVSGFCLERVVLRPLMGRPVIAVVMATIGVAAIIRGLGPLVFGIGTRSIPVPFNDAPLLLGSVMIPPVQLAGAAVSVAFVVGFSWLFTKSRAGIAMRAVADSQTVALAMGINVPRYFAYAWALAGVVSAIGGVFWGVLLGADNQLAVIGMKVFPVVILGGLDSIIGAVVAGILVGVLENLTAGYLDQYVGGGMKDLVPYLVMIVVLMFRPYGLFGKKRIERI